MIARQLQEQRYSIALDWVLAHSEVTRNKKANLVAKNKVARGGKQAKRWSSLKYIKNNLIKAQDTEFMK